MTKDANPILEDGEILTTALHLPHDLYFHYPMLSKDEIPLFKYLVKTNTDMEYWLFSDFDCAVKFAHKLNKQTEDMVIIYDLYYNNRTREFYLQKTFWVWFDGVLNFDKHGDIELHVYFYLKAGAWMNPNPDWLSLLAKKHNSINKVEEVEDQS